MILTKNPRKRLDDRTRRCRLGRLRNRFSRADVVPPRPASNASSIRLEREGRSQQLISPGLSRRRSFPHEYNRGDPPGRPAVRRWTGPTW
ncbi:hypothetical protein Franean1_1470 [Parafrankia sp. EAN1pec]|nr:hypothetical protein Franean1_1470 [Frankia sp. EAN1pec]